MIICWIINNNYFVNSYKMFTKQIGSGGGRAVTLLAEQAVRGSIPRLATWISEIAYLLLLICEIQLKRRKSSIKPINQPNKLIKGVVWPQREDDPLKITRHLCNITVLVATAGLSLTFSSPVQYQ